MSQSRMVEDGFHPHMEDRVLEPCDSRSLREQAPHLLAASPWMPPWTAVLAVALIASPGLADDAVPTAEIATTPTEESTAATAAAGQNSGVDRQMESAVDADHEYRKRYRMLSHYEYLDDSRIGYFFPNKGVAHDDRLVFEAQAATHLFIWNEWYKVEAKTESGEWRWVNSADVSFAIQLRMIQQESAPVRPPSYMPGIHYQGFLLWKPRAEQGGHLASPDPPTEHVNQLALLLGITHHSNGQQQCAFAERGHQENPTRADCLTDVDYRHPPTGRVNYRSGDFSTTFGTVRVDYARIGLAPDHYLRWRWGGGLEYEENFVDRGWMSGIPGAMSRGPASMYGVHRFKATLEGSYHTKDLASAFSGLWSLSTSVQLMPHRAVGIPVVRWIAEGRYLPDGLHGAGGFVRYLDGQDELNILSAAGRCRMVQFGVVWNTSPFLQYLFGEGWEVQRRTTVPAQGTLEPAP